MKFSIITPTHSQKNIPFLIELYQSIVEQKYKDWEWVLYLNGDMTKSKLPKGIARHPQVVIHQATGEDTNVGAVKNKAFRIGTGDVLVEVDHDDMILPECLEELCKAFQDKEVGFAYSDSITYRLKGDQIPYNPQHGWKYQKVWFRNKDYLSHYHFPPSSHSLAYIWYAPDHVRAWRASVYRELGGHNPALSVCDDHELCIKTYLSTKMKLIQKPLYVYRITGDNTWLERNALIQQTTRGLFDQYAMKLAEKDADDKGLLKVDIGGGLRPYPGYTTVDVRETADHVADLNDGIPLPDNSVGVLRAHHIIEHLKDPIHTMSEIHRVLAHGGWAFIEVPSTDGRGAWQDPTHISFWNQNSFFYYTRKEQAEFIDNDTIRFQQAKLDTYFPNKWHKDNDIPVVSAVLVAVKNNEVRYPGLLMI
jgi:glycosyltransferase involved in cell wall biosynthesis